MALPLETLELELDDELLELTLLVLLTLCEGPPEPAVGAKGAPLEP